MSSRLPPTCATRGRLQALVVATALGVALVALPAGAQVEPSGEIRLLRQTAELGPKDSLGLEVEVTNRGDSTLNGFVVSTALYSKVEGRIELHTTFDGVDAAQTGTHPREVDRRLEPGESVLVSIDPPLQQAFPALGEQGVYPLTVSLFDRTGQSPLDDFTTHLIYYPEPVEDPLNLVLVVPLAPLPARAPDGTFVVDGGDATPLDTAVGPGGWLRGLLAALNKEASGGLRAGVAPSPRLVEELTDMANGYSRQSGDQTEEVGRDDPMVAAAAETLDGIEALLGGEGIQPLVSPYSAPDLPTTYKHLSPEHTSAQLNTGRTTLEQLLPDIAFNPQWLFTTGSRWDHRTLEQAAGVGGLSTFISGTFESPIDETVSGCPANGPDGSFTCPVRVGTGSASVQAYVRDPDVQNRFTELVEPGSDVLDLQRLLAETALIHLEIPADARRIIHATVPALWEPSPHIARRLFRSLSRASWLEPRRPDEGFDHARTPRSRPLVEEADEIAEFPGIEYFEELTDVALALGRFEEIDPPESRLQRLQRNLLVAESRSWWPDLTDRGGAYATDTRDEIDSEFAKITVSGPDTTLTSQRSAIEVNVFNETGYPVTVDVDFTPYRPDEMRIDESDINQLKDITVEPGAAPPINVDAIADSSGIFTVEARVLTPDSGTLINGQEIVVRSTNFNQIALGITFGALAFLILFYVLRFVRRRRVTSRPATERSTP